MRGLRRFARPPRLLGRTAIAVVLVMVGMAYGYAARRGDTAGQRLVRALLAERFTTGRLTGQTAWHPCAARDTAALVPRMRCGGPPEQERRRSRRIADVADAARAAAPGDSSAATLRADALLDLRFADTATAPAERAAAALEAAHRLAPDDAGVLNELAVAYLAVGERTQELTPMLRALDAVERAAERDSLRPEILFNRALIHQRLYLVASAGRAWARYLAVERDPAWRREAEAHARWVAQVPNTVAWDRMLASPPVRMDSAARAQIAARVRRSPQKAREFGFTLLGAWGEAVQAGDSVRAARLLAVAREIGAAERALGVDESVRLAVEAIATSADPRRLQALAAGQVELREGMSLFAGDKTDRAVQVLARSEESLRAAGSPAWHWAAFYRAASSVNRVDYESGDRILVRLLDEAGTDEPALAGKAIWALGLSQLRRGSYETASLLYHQARPHIAKAGEAENLGAIAVLIAEGASLSGQQAFADSEAYLALRLVAAYRRSTFLNNHLANVSAYCRDQGLNYAALAVGDEMVWVARGIGHPTLLALALSAQLRNVTAVGRFTEARHLSTEALAWADSMQGRGGDRIRAHVTLALGQAARRSDASVALPLLQRAVAAYTSFGSDFYLPTALHEAALAARQTGERARARAWLVQAIEHVERQRASFTSTETQTAFYETVESIFDEIIDLDLRAGRQNTAFQVLERGRIHARPWQTHAAGTQGEYSPGASPEDVRLALPPEMLLVEYVLLRDRMVIWTISRSGTRTHTIATPRDSIAALVNAARRRPSTTEAWGHLYDLLLRPIEEELRNARRLVIVPDRELYLIPFTALRNQSAGRYVVEEHEVSTVPSAGYFLTAMTMGRGSTEHPRALVIGNPALDLVTGAGLPALPGAMREATAIARLNPGSTLLQGADASRDRILPQLPRHSIVHFAGHAVLNVDQPERSYLALAQDDRDESGMLRAQDIARLPLSGVRVVVLSACSSLNPRPSRTGAVSGLAYSFLRAGAPATVSTVWDVDDGPTPDLLIEFHRRLAAGASAAEALRLAQVAALRSARPELRSPAVWAAFVYTGP